jgi:phytoene dehydrogenase-like protein
VEGAQVKVNLLLSRLPRLLDSSVSAEEAFGGTFHINELASQLRSSIDQARQGDIPEVIPCEIYCHSLSDPSILGPELQESGAQTLTVFALNIPHRLIRERNADEVRAELQDRVLSSLNSVLAEPIEDCVLRDPSGQLCIETKTTLDLEASVGLPGGNIFHEPLRWPFVEDDDPLDSPTHHWGVDTGIEGVVCAGSGARRGGGVSGIGGHNAAMATLELLGLA